MLEGRSLTIKKGPFRGMRGRVISATATHVRLELEAQMKTVTVDRWTPLLSSHSFCSSASPRACFQGGSLHFARRHSLTPHFTRLNP